MKEIKVNIKESPYNVVISKCILNKVKDVLFDYNILKSDDSTKILLITDEGVPDEYINIVKSQFKNINIKKVPSGEDSKSLNTYVEIMSLLLKLDFTRKDMIIALGGGVVGDLSAYVASTYMRGISFVNIPTTLLSQVDSSVGGKTGLNHDGVKNVLGTFYQPKIVIIDIDLLKTLPKKQICSGMAESIKMGISLNKDLFEYIDKFDYEKLNNDSFSELTEIVEMSVDAKRIIVEQDSKEQGLRRVLNFGHTIGHGIEAYYGNSGYLHGECVAIGMIPMVRDDLREKLVEVLKKYDLPTKIKLDVDKAINFISRDKKKENDLYNVVLVNEIGKCEIKQVDINTLREKLLIIS